MVSGGALLSCSPTALPCTQHPLLGSPSTHIPVLWAPRGAQRAHRYWFIRESKQASPPALPPEWFELKHPTSLGNVSSVIHMHDAIRMKQVQLKKNLQEDLLVNLHSEHLSLLCCNALKMEKQTESCSALCIQQLLLPNWASHRGKGFSWAQVGNEVPINQTDGEQLGQMEVCFEPGKHWPPWCQEGVLCNELLCLISSPCSVLWDAPPPCTGVLRTHLLLWGGHLRSKGLGTPCCFVTPWQCAMDAGEPGVCGVILELC